MYCTASLLRRILAADVRFHCFHQHVCCVQLVRMLLLPCADPTPAPTALTAEPTAADTTAEPTLAATTLQPTAAPTTAAPTTAAPTTAAPTTTAPTTAQPSVASGGTAVTAPTAQPTAAGEFYGSVRATASATT
jgi:hypothetical protein